MKSSKLINYSSSHVVVVVVVSRDGHMEWVWGSTETEQ
jgi:hypothetical protein